MLASAAAVQCVTPSILHAQGEPPTCQVCLRKWTNFYWSTAGNAVTLNSELANSEFHCGIAVSVEAIRDMSNVHTDQTQEKGGPDTKLVGSICNPKISHAWQIFCNLHGQFLDN